MFQINEHFSSISPFSIHLSAQVQDCFSFTSPFSFSFNPILKAKISHSTQNNCEAEKSSSTSLLGTSPSTNIIRVSDHPIQVPLNPISIPLEKSTLTEEPDSVSTTPAEAGPQKPPTLPLKDNISWIASPTTAEPEDYLASHPTYHNSPVVARQQDNLPHTNTSTFPSTRQRSHSFVSKIIDPLLTASRQRRRSSFANHRNGSNSFVNHTSAESPYFDPNSSSLDRLPSSNSAQFNIFGQTQTSSILTPTAHTPISGLSSSPSSSAFDFFRRRGSTASISSEIHQHHNNSTFFNYQFHQNSQGQSKNNLNTNHQKGYHSDLSEDQLKNQASTSSVTSPGSFFPRYIKRRSHSFHHKREQSAASNSSASGSFHSSPAEVTGTKSSLLHPDSTSEALDQTTGTSRASQQQPKSRHRRSSSIVQFIESRFSALHIGANQNLKSSVKADTTNSHSSTEAPDSSLVQKTTAHSLTKEQAKDTRQEQSLNTSVHNFGTAPQLVVSAPEVAKTSNTGGDNLDTLSNTSSASQTQSKELKSIASSIGASIVGLFRSKPNKKKLTLAERRAAAIPRSPLLTPVQSAESPHSSSGIDLQPPRLNTLAFNSKSDPKGKSPDLSPLSANSTMQTMTMTQTANQLSAEQYIPVWLAERYPSDVNAARRNIQKIHNDLQELERVRIKSNKRSSPGDSETQFSRDIASHVSNFRKNRYQDVQPYDFSRVVLPFTTTQNALPPSTPISDYINASHLISLGHYRHYIAAQGPLPNTFGDFWHMVWAEMSAVIVMLTPEEEKGRIKCHRYWPSSTEAPISFQFASEIYTIHLNREVELWDGKAIQREFTLDHKSQSNVDSQFSVDNDADTMKSSRKIHMVHFLAWPDHQASDANVVLQLVDLCNSLNNAASVELEHQEDTQLIPGPMVVHCSAGIGRTGTFCVIDSVLHMLGTKKGSLLPLVTFQSPRLPFADRNSFEWERLPKSDLVALHVNHFRRQRPGCVQTSVQLTLCYDAILARMKSWYAAQIPVSWVIRPEEFPNDNKDSGTGNSGSVVTSAPTLANSGQQVSRRQSFGLVPSAKTSITSQSKRIPNTTGTGTFSIDAASGRSTDVNAQVQDSSSWHFLNGLKRHRPSSTPKNPETVVNPGHTKNTSFGSTGVPSPVILGSIAPNTAENSDAPSEENLPNGQSRFVFPPPTDRHV